MSELWLRVIKRMSCEDLQKEYEMLSVDAFQMIEELELSEFSRGELKKYINSRIKIIEEIAKEKDCILKKIK